MTYPYGAIAMPRFALTYLYAMLVVPPFPHQCTVELSLSQSICFLCLLFFFRFSLISPPLTVISGPTRSLSRFTVPY